MPSKASITASIHWGRAAAAACGEVSFMEGALPTAVGNVDQKRGDVRELAGQCWRAEGSQSEALSLPEGANGRCRSGLGMKKGVEYTPWFYVRSRRLITSQIQPRRGAWLQ